MSCKLPGFVFFYFLTKLTIRVYILKMNYMQNFTHSYSNSNTLKSWNNVRGKSLTNVSKCALLHLIMLHQLHLPLSCVRTFTYHVAYFLHTGWRIGFLSALLRQTGDGLKDKMVCYAVWTFYWYGVLYTVSLSISTAVFWLASSCGDEHGLLQKVHAVAFITTTSQHSYTLSIWKTATEQIFIIVLPLAHIHRLVDSRMRHEWWLAVAELTQFECFPFHLSCTRSSPATDQQNPTHQMN